MLCYFVSDIHGSTARYNKLFAEIERERPQAVFFGGDLLPHRYISRDVGQDFLNDFLLNEFRKSKANMGDKYPRVFLIMGNDDVRQAEAVFIDAQKEGLWEYLHLKKSALDKHAVYGYTNVTPTPFRLKDWERYDIDFTLRDGSLAPEAGVHTTVVNIDEIKTRTIADDLHDLTDDDDLSQAILMIHTPPYKTNLDRLGWPGIPEENRHVGSVALRRLIEKRQPLIVLCGHIHESPAVTGSWKDKIGDTYCFSAAHDGPELSLVKFDPTDPDSAVRKLL